MIQAIVDDRDIDTILDLEQWAQIKRIASQIAFPSLYWLTQGVEVQTADLENEIVTMDPCPYSVQRLLAYALGGSRIKCVEIGDAK